MDLNDLSNKDLTTVLPYMKNMLGQSTVAIGDTFTPSQIKAVQVKSDFITPDGVTHSIDIVLRNILPDASLFYGFDGGAYFRGIGPQDFDQHLRLDNIDEIAQENIDNFITNTHPLQMQTTDVGLYLMVCGGNYESVLIIMQHIWEVLQAQLESDLYVAIPARDLCMFAATNNLPAIDAMKNLAKQVYPTAPKQVSKYLYKVQGNSWKVMENMID
jgi:uncharacterized protein YtpQ (UPF0354 family)